MSECPSCHATLGVVGRKGFWDDFSGHSFFCGLVLGVLLAITATRHGLFM
jgi:hypothetical protein